MLTATLVEHFNFFTPSFSEKLPLFFTQHLKISEILTFCSTFVTLLKIYEFSSYIFSEKMHEK
jgi:hypothetical protein